MDLLGDIGEARRNARDPDQERDLEAERRDAQAVLLGWLSASLGITMFCLRWLLSFNLYQKVDKRA
jgi:hypothetical protein